MAKYHVNPATGNPGICRAQKKCRFGGDAAHFATPEAARAGFEKTMEQAPPRKKPPVDVLLNALDTHKRANVEREVVAFLEHTEMGGQFDRHSLTVDEAGESFTLKVDLSFSDGVNHYKAGETVRLDRNFTVFERVS